MWLGYSTYNYGAGIYNISNPAAPVLMSIYNPSPPGQNQFELGVLRHRIGFFGSWSGGGLHIVSLSNAAAPVLLARVSSTNGNGFDRVHTLFLEREFLYEAAHVAGTSTVKVFNVANPSAPVFLRDIVTTNTTKVHQITARQKDAQTLLFTSGWGGNDNGNPASPGQTDIWDVSNVGTQPAPWLGRIYSGYNSHSSWPTPDGNTLIVCRETPGGDVRFYDISNPATIPSNAAPFLTLTPAAIGLEDDIPHNPVVVSNFLFLSWYQNGLQVFDITDRTNPVRVAFFDTYPAAKTSSYQGNWGVFPWLGFDRILLSDIQSGMFILNGTALLTPTNNYPPLMAKSPASLTTTQGFTAVFAPTITGSLLQYQWRFNGNNLADATNSSHTLPAVQAEQVGYYSVVITNASGAATSTNALLTLLDSPYLHSVRAAAGSRGALISWNTTVPGDSLVQFDPATLTIPGPSSLAAQAQGSFSMSSYVDRRTVTNHVLLLTGLAPGTRYSYQVLSLAGTNTYISGVYQFTTAGTNIVDNPEATVTGAWTLARTAADKYASDYVFATTVAGAPTATVNFQPDFNTPGQYDVAVWYPQDGNVASNAPYTIHFKGGSTTIPVNQQNGGGAWQTIGSALEFATGPAGNVALANNAAPTVVLADAVRFSYVEVQDFPAGPTMPAWWRDSFFAGAADPNADPDADGFSTAQKYLIGTSPVDPTSRLTLSAQTDATAARITFWPYLGNRRYQLLVRTAVDDPAWQVYQPVNIQPTPYGHGVFTVPLTNAPRCFFRVAVRWDTNSTFSGALPVAAGRAVSAFASEATCGPNRAYVRQSADDDRIQR